MAYLDDHLIDPPDLWAPDIPDDCPWCGKELELDDRGRCARCGEEIEP